MRDIPQARNFRRIFKQNMNQIASAWLGIPYVSAEILPKNKDEENVRLENLEVVPFPTT